MKKLSTMALAVLVAAALSIPAVAQEAPTPTVVPEVVNIEDPAGDANYLNDQGNGEVGDNVGPADASTVADILKVWFTHDVDVIRAHILTEAPHSANTASAYFYRVQIDPGGEPNCLRLQIATPGPTSPTTAETTGSLRDLCGGNDETFTEGITATIEATPDGQGIATVVIPRSTHPAFADNLVLAAPTAHSRNYLGGAATAPQVDTTAPGTDYTITAEEVIEEKPVKKGCKKGSPKAKKKGCKKR
jgi:hypothetical protein